MSSVLRLDNWSEEFPASRWRLLRYEGGRVPGDDTDHGGWDDKQAARTHFAGTSIRLILVCKMVRRPRKLVMMVDNTEGDDGSDVRGALSCCSCSAHLADC